MSLRELKDWLVSALDRDSQNDPGLRAQALGGLALVTANLGEPEGARAYARQCLALGRERDDLRQIEWGLRVLSFDEPNLETRRQQLHECERLNHEVGNGVGLGWVTFLMAATLLEEGRFEQAQLTFEKSATIFASLNRHWEAANANVQVGFALIAQGDEPAALPIFAANLRIATELQAPSLATPALAGMAAARLGTDPDLATQLLAAAWAIADEHGQPLDADPHTYISVPAKQRAREQLGESFDTAWDAGSKLTLDEAVALALNSE
jgi:tetratricopeptide (TPR) repeat protein